MRRTNSPTHAPMPVTPVLLSELPGPPVQAAVDVCGWRLVVDEDGCCAVFPVPSSPAGIALTESVANTWHAIRKERAA